VQSTLVDPLHSCSLITIPELCAVGAYL